MSTAQPVDGGLPPLRDLGGLEHTYDYWSREHPSHFCVAAELVVQHGELDVERLCDAVAAAVDRHPLLGADVVLPTGDPFHGQFVPHGRAAVIEVREPTDGGHGPALTDVIAGELSRPFAADRPTPRVRAVVVPLPGGDASPQWALVLTFDHQVADGISALHVLDDVVARLSGRDLPRLPFPVAREALLAAADDAGHAAPARPEAPAAPAAPPKQVRPWDGAVPNVRGDALDVAETAELLTRCRGEGTTVNGALVAACLHALAGAGEPFRVNVPVDLRPRVHSGTQVGLYMGNADLTFVSATTTPFWDLARDVAARTRAAAAVPALRASADVIDGLLGSGMSRVDLESALVAGLGFDLLVSNLGAVRTPDPQDQVTLGALWGPAVLTQIDGERMLGAITSGGRLRVLSVSHEEWPDVLGPLRAATRSE